MGSPDSALPFIPPIRRNSYAYYPPVPSTGIARFCLRIQLQRLQVQPTASFFSTAGQHQPLCWEQCDSKRTGGFFTGRPAEFRECACGKLSGGQAREFQSIGSLKPTSSACANRIRSSSGHIDSCSAR
jgi:hypothetical protein